MKVVRIVWRDAHHIGPGEWIDRGCKAGVEVVTVGFYLGRRNGCHVVAHTRQADGSVTGVFAIPASNVVEKSTLH